MKAADQYGFIRVVPSIGRCWDIVSNKTRMLDGGDSDASKHCQAFASASSLSLRIAAEHQKETTLRRLSTPASDLGRESLHSNDTGYVFIAGARYAAITDYLPK